MQTAQNLIKAYRRKRIIVCLMVALFVLLLTFGLRFISQRDLIQDRLETYAIHAVNSLDKILIPIAGKRHELVSLVGQPCENVHLPIRKQAAALQTLRSIALVKSGVLYCSSVFGNRDVVLRDRQPTLPDPQPKLLLATDESLVKGSPILIQWYPASQDGEDGVMLTINIHLLSSLLLEPQTPDIRRVVVSVGNRYYSESQGISDSIQLADGEEMLTRQSELFPFSISVTTPGAAMLALEDLPSQAPLAVILALVLSAVAWLATAGRVSFNREITHGMAQREFELYCQPQLNTRTQQCTGVEILLRWNNPRLGWISPDVFIPVAERENLIAPLTRYVLVETIRQIGYFPADPQFHISINVASSHFLQGALLRDVNQFWFSARPKQQLVLEITERDNLMGVDYRLVRELHRKGVRLAIDDFGTGSSALSWLEQLRPDILKIDKSFTNAIGTDAVNSTVTDIIIALGHRLNIELVAEGVETPQQAHYLRQHGVSILQGYLYAKPMPLAEFPRWLQGGTPPPKEHSGHVLPVIL
ncbi:EAL domain-containing protein [Enterobacter sp. CC120223-11]|uniref:EAL domain-containing protein n=1 Tax=Enterobacter sp. CC120223-11 TaxID=1378073 RepID=UPI000BC4D0E2|nr:EAL domain-containing protein [Enterobacter sp. CC120223-11]SNY73760.1 EAL domain, c-di-GMP-specific phosphodiesterase class I (or its enzymatically inactive variant) [Enterobacter sp. CC120223-11]